MADNVIEAVKWGDINEQSEVYLKEAIDALIDREREAAIGREKEIKDLIGENDAVFDDMTTALDPVVELTDFDISAEGAYTVNDIANRMNILVHVLQRLRQGLLD